MGFGNLNLATFLFGVPALLLAISVHEFSHGMMAYKLGDPTPKYQGRLTLNPLVHLDPMGAIMLLLFRFGWAKPVMINPVYFKNRRRGMIYVALAGPVSNVILAWVFYNLTSICYLFLTRTAFTLSLVTFLNINIAYNLGLAAFNLIPIPPLDGSKILGGLLPPKYAFAYARISEYAPLILIILLVTGGAQFVIGPIYRLLHSLISIISI